MAQQTESMEDILTSIRTGVEGAASGAVDDVLELVPDDIVEEAAAPVNGKANGHTNGHSVDEVEDEGLIDINAFAAHAEEKPAENVVSGGDVLGENDVLAEGVEPVAEVVAAPVPVVEEAKLADDKVKAAEDEFDKLLSELGDEGATTPVEVAPAAEVAVEIPTEVPVAEPVMEEVVAEEVLAPVEEVVAVPAVAAVADRVVERIQLESVVGSGGLQVAFPAEVLAAALRPMVRDWVAENLPSIVERLVKEEIGKLTQE